jgi:tetratricopeptide (TPR) repeat protein
MRLGLALRIIYRAFNMFFVGETFKKIRLACLVDCGNYFHNKEHIDRAIKYYQKALNVEPDDYYANIGLAGALVMNKSFGESLNFFKKANSLKKPGIMTLTLMFAAYKALDKEDSQNKVLKELKNIFDDTVFIPSPALSPSLSCVPGARL